MKKWILNLGVLSIGATCHKPVIQTDISMYSYNLEANVELTIISTPMPSNPLSMNLLLLNDGQDLGQWGVFHIVDSLFKKNKIQPLLIVGIHAHDRMQDYGVSGHPDYGGHGAKAATYAKFIDEELMEFIEKRTGIEKFHSIAVAGCSLGGLSAFDYAWDHADKIDKVGVFSGSFWWRDKSATDSTYSQEANRIMINKVRSSTHASKLKYWFYAGTSEENSDRDNDGIIDVIDDTQDLMHTIRMKEDPDPSSMIYVQGEGALHDYPYWKKVLPAFLLWGFGRK